MLMLPFLYTYISQLLRSVLKLIVKEELLQACSFGMKLSKIDLDRQIIFKKKQLFYLRLCYRVDYCRAEKE